MSTVQPNLRGRPAHHARREIRSPCWLFGIHSYSWKLRTPRISPPRVSSFASTACMTTCRTGDRLHRHATASRRRRSAPPSRRGVARSNSSSSELEKSFTFAKTIFDTGSEALLAAPFFGCPLPPRSYRPGRVPPAKDEPHASSGSGRRRCRLRAGRTPLLNQHHRRAALPLSPGRHSGSRTVHPPRAPGSWRSQGPQEVLCSPGSAARAVPTSGCGTNRVVPELQTRALWRADEHRGRSNRFRV